MGLAHRPTPIVRSLSRIAVVLSLLFTLLFFSVTFLPVLGPWIGALSAPWADRPTGTLIVLAGDATAGHLRGLTAEWRAVYAVFEWRQGGYQQIIFSGGAGIAESMRDFAVAQGVPGAVIQLETRSQTTHEQAVFVSDMLRGSPGTKVLVCGYIKMLWLAFRKAGLDVIPRPFPDARKRAGRFESRWPVFIELSRETVKYWFYRWNGWI